MQTVQCHYDGQLVHTFEMSDRELKIMTAEPGGARFLLYQRLKRTLPDLAIDDAAKFDYVISLKGA